MTSIRATPRSTMQIALDNLSSNLDRMSTLQEQLSSGKQINRPSDSPIGTIQAMQYRSDIRRNDQFQRNADDGLSWLGMADNTLTSMLPILSRVKELVLQGMNGSSDSVQRGNIAQEVNSLRDTLVGQANTKYLDRPIFAGNSNTAMAYDQTNLQFIGSANDQIQRRVAPNQKVRVNLTGPEVFGPDGVGANGNLFQIVDQIAKDLQTSPSSLSSDLTSLNNATVNLENQLGAVGARYNQVDGMKSRAEDQSVTLKNGLSDVENIDLPQTIVNLQLQEIAYKSALSATSQVIQPSLLDFLR
jgi:flagellar hook-associated protein 3 FlgL